MKIFTSIVLFATVLFSCQNDQTPLSHYDTQLFQTMDQIDTEIDFSSFILPEDGDYSQFAQEPLNPMTPVKVELGKFLFFETGLGADAVQEVGKFTYSCATCHIPAKGFMPGTVQGIADGAIGFGTNGEARSKFHLYDEDELDTQGARPLSLLNVGYMTNTSWSGMFGAGGANEGTEDQWIVEKGTDINHLGLAGLESQNIEGLHLHRMHLDKEVADEYGYTPLFDAAFPEIPEEDRYSIMTTSFAISAYLRSLVPNQAPFQKWLKGDMNAMTNSEKEGANLFFGKAGCINCHTGPGLNNQKFFAIGVKDLYETGVAFATGPDDRRNLGRGGFTSRAEDLYKFKVPQIYNMANSPFYFHGSSKRSLREVVEYFNDAVIENDNVDKNNISGFFRPLDLTEEEITDLTQFLETGLYDPNLDRYMPKQILSGNCFPNNDLLSKFQTGCE